MTTMAVVTQENSAPAVVRWAARFAQMRGDTLIVIYCLIEDQPQIPLTPVYDQHELIKPVLLQTNNEIIGEFEELKIEFFVMRHPDPAKVIIQEIKDRGVNFLCAGMDFMQPRHVPVNRLCQRLLRFAPCDMFVLDPGGTDGSRYQRVLLPMGMHLGPFTLRSAVDLAEKSDCTIIPLEVGSYFGTDSQHVARRTLQSKLDEAGIKATKSIQPTVALTGDRWKAILNKSRNIDLLLTGAGALRDARRF
ncbi:MAG: universal stress protein, partial [Deltaproteobacteria bacterium]|nr:universal stress protein [Deltaproteobacteria bacterium]